jgi:hypothetical protein
MQLDCARYFLGLALDPPLLSGLERDRAIGRRKERLAGLDAAGLRTLTRENRSHPAARLAAVALDRADKLLIGRWER